MALMAVVYHILDGLVQPPPDEVCRYELTHRPDSRVVDVMEAFDDLLTEGDGDDDPGSVGGAVVVQHIPRWQAFGRAGEAGGVA